MMRRPFSKWCAAAASIVVGLPALLGSHISAFGAEYGRQFYLLGVNAASGVAITPPPGAYYSSIKYIYSGDASGSAAAGVTLDRLGAQITAEANIDVEGNFVLDIPYGFWVAPHKVLGATPGFGVLMPIGYIDVTADLTASTTLTLADGRRFRRGQSFGLKDDTFSYGDLVLNPFLGWSRGNFHWRLFSFISMPTGQYSKGSLANLGINRWALDVSGAMTWLDPALGLEISSVAGFTFNGKNPKTQYRTGTEFHVEWALMKHFSKAFAVGLVGFHYEQISDDTGPGATLGPFKGRVTALGVNANYNFNFRSIPVATSLRWMHDMDNVKNRLKGDLVIFTATVPLGGLRR